jgi:hypothetical protein
LIIVIAGASLAALAALLTAKETIKEILERIIAAIVALSPAGGSAAPPYFWRRFRAYIYHRGFYRSSHLSESVAQLLR